MLPTAAVVTLCYLLALDAVASGGGNSVGLGDGAWTLPHQATAQHVADAQVS